ncbi:MAG: hypothetical protein IKQ72_01490 [Bacteroidaceae bacterium]|nr:hypothetical protein [Bacteroidaceae bacterium]
MNKYILSFIAGCFFSLSSFAQWGGVSYTFDDSHYGATDDHMGEVVFGDDYQVKEVNLFVNDKFGFSRLTIYASGTLKVVGRYREIPSTIYTIDPLNYNSYYFEGSYISPDDTTLNKLSYSVTEPEWDEDTEDWSEPHYYSLDDMLRYYWLTWRAAKRLEAENPSTYRFERGSEIIGDVLDAQGFPIEHAKYGNELFYFVSEGENGAKSYFPVLRAEISGSNSAVIASVRDDEVDGWAEEGFADRLASYGDFEFTFKAENCTKLYFSTEIEPEVFDFSESNSRYKTEGILRTMVPLSLGFAPIFEMLPSFQNCKVSDFYVDAQNAYYISICGGQVLCTKDEDGNPRTIIAVAQGEGEIDLPLTVDSIAPNAVTYDAQGLKLVTQNSKFKVAEGSGFVTYSSKEGRDVNSIKIQTGLSPEMNYIKVPASYIKSAKSNGSYGIVQPQSTISVSEAKASVGTLSNNSAVCYIDLTNCTIDGTDNGDMGEIDMSIVGPNCLLFLPEGISASGNNVVTFKNGVRTCENLTLERANGFPFFSPYNFVAENVSITNYNIGANIVGLILPFEYSNDNVKLATYTGFSNGALNFDNTVTTIPANTPFVARKKDDVADQPLSAKNVTIASTPTTVSDFPADGWLMNGTYLTVTNNGTDCSIYGFSKNVLKKVEGATFKPFSAYFVHNKANGASEANVRFLVNDDDITGLDSVLSLSSVSAGNGVINVTASNSNVVVASVNGAVLFDGVVNGTKTIKVQPGVYVVNGKKVVVNK